MDMRCPELNTCIPSRVKNRAETIQGTIHPALDIKGLLSVEIGIIPSDIIAHDKQTADYNGAGDAADQAVG